MLQKAEINRTRETVKILAVRLLGLHCRRKNDSNDRLLYTNDPSLLKTEDSSSALLLDVGWAPGRRVAAPVRTSSPRRCLGLKIGMGSRLDLPDPGCTRCSAVPFAPVAMSQNDQLTFQKP